MIDVLFDRPRAADPDVSLILLDWSCRESFHMLDYLAGQDVPRDRFEVVWIEYYDRVSPEIRQHLESTGGAGKAPAIDRWIVMNMPRDAYYHKHLMYNLGIIAARGRIVTICDSDAMVRPTLVASIIRAFDEAPDIALHLDEVRNVNRTFYPFNYPSFEEVTGEGAINWKDGKTTGLWEREDPLHVLNYGACLCARRDDLMGIGGADEHIDYLGHICGPYDLTWRLGNVGKREIWHATEFFYHTWHPGTDGDENYLGPHDGRNVSTTALAARRGGRVMPLVENPVVRRLRTEGGPAEPLRQVLADAIGGRALDDWKIDEVKRRVSAGRAAYGRREYAAAIAVWEDVAGAGAQDSGLLCDLAWAYYFAGRYQEANAAFDEVLSLDARNPHAYRGRGWTLLQCGRYAEASGDFTAAIDGLGGFEAEALQEAVRGRGWTSFHLGHYDAAMADFELGLSRASETNHGARQDLHRGLGWSLLKVGDLVASEAQFAAALTHLGPEEAAVQADARSGLAQARAGRPVPADAPATATPGPVEPTRMRSAPGRPTPPLAQPPVGVPIRSALAQQLGWAYYQRGLFDEALGLFEQALASAPDNLRARAGRGWTLVQLRRPQAAIGELDRVIQSSEAEAWQLQEALRGRGWARYRLRDFSGAVSDFTRAFEYAGPDETGVREDLLRGRSRAWYRLGRYDLAAADIAHRAGRDGRPPAGRLAVAASVYVAALRWRLGRMARLMRPKGV